MKRRRWLLRGGRVVSGGQDVVAVGVADVGAAVRAADEAPAGASRLAGGDVAACPIADLVRVDAGELGESLLDLAGGFGVDRHALSEADLVDGTPLVVRPAADGSVALLVTSEKLGVLLSVESARSLARSLVAVAEEVAS